MREFLSGQIAVHVTNEEQSKFLIDLSERNGLSNEKGSKEFSVDTYKDYPFYFVESNSQIKASVSEENLAYFNDVDVVIDFNEAFPMV